jgi:hypothetical protein
MLCNKCADQAVWGVTLIEREGKKNKIREYYRCEEHLDAELCDKFKAAGALLEALWEDKEPRGRRIKMVS